MGQSIYDFAAGETADDTALVKRIAAAYRAAVTIHVDPPGAMWTEFFAHKKPIADALLKDDIGTAAALLRDPTKNMLTFGFDSLYPAYTEKCKTDSGERDYQSSLIHSTLVRLAEVIGAVRTHNPESGRPAPHHAADDLVAAISATLGKNLAFPTPFADEFGLASSAGVISYRPVQAIYQAYLINEELNLLRGGRRVLEIGGGMGRTAYYSLSHKWVNNYVIADLPITGVAQAYFLGRTLGPDRVCLYGEEPQMEQIHLVPPEALFTGPREGFDLVINVDSLTEMARADADRYVAYAAERAVAFLSINHEANSFTVREILQTFAIPHTRRTCPIRPGYAEERILFRHSASYQ